MVARYAHIVSDGIHDIDRRFSQGQCSVGIALYEVTSINQEYGLAFSLVGVLERFDGRESDTVLVTVMTVGVIRVNNHEIV